MEPTDERKATKKMLEDSFEEMYQEDVEAHKDEFEQIKQNFLKESGPKKKKKRNGILSKIGFVAALVCVIFVVSFIMSDIPEIKAFRYDISEKVNSFFTPKDNYEFLELDQLAEKEGIVFPAFSYLPVGFEMGDVSYKDFGDTYVVNYTLTKEDEYISVMIETYNGDEARSEQFSFNDFERIDKEDKIIALSQSPPYTAVVFMKMYEIRLSTNISREEILKIVDGIQ
ncbi:hypothetical protein CE91St36_19650 [Christensenellaceae bacterium]|nr:hypothetical protein CE91St36_19650 [Christensenellaceae bacterium]BDF61814.1 hypothetical protein CE91St37_19640 [Christensenellaceae bacterium]